MFNVLSNDETGCAEINLEFWEAYLSHFVTDILCSSRTFVAFTLFTAMIKTLALFYRYFLNFPLS